MARDPFDSSAPGELAQGRLCGKEAKRKALFGPVHHRASRALLVLRLGVLRSRFKQIRRGAQYEGHEAPQAKASCRDASRFVQFAVGLSMESTTSVSTAPF